MKKKEIAVVYITDQNYALPTCVSAVSVIVNKSVDEKIRIYIICYQVSADDIKRFQDLANEDVEIIIIEKNEEEHIRLGQNSDLDRVSSIALYKFGLARMLDLEDKVLYLDGDVIVQGSLYSLFNTDISECYLAAVNDIVNESINMGCERRIHLKSQEYFNSGVMLLNLMKMREDDIEEHLIDYKLNGINHFMDQDALNYVLEDKRLKLSFHSNFLSTIFDFLTIEDIYQRYPINSESSYAVEEYLSNILIVHLTGNLKPWEYELPWFTKIFKDYYKVSPYKDCTLVLKSPIKKMGYDQQQLLPELLIPYEKIAPGEKIVLYGAGITGRKCKAQLEGLGFGKVVLWVDKMADKLDENISRIEEIVNIDYDYVLIAIKSLKAIEQARRSLVQECGIENNKIIDIYGRI